MPPYIIQSRCELRVTDNSLSERTVTTAEADMDAKFVFAVLLALQVSMALAAAPQPDADVVQKFGEMKETFMRRVQNLMAKMEAAAAENPNAQAAREAIAQNEKMGTAKELLVAFGQEAQPMLEKAETGALGLYSVYVRPYFGDYLAQGITHIKSFLDQIAPANK